MAQIPMLPYWQPRVLSDSPAERARKKLLSCLNDEQRRTFLEHGYFDVTGSLGTLWRINGRGSYAGNLSFREKTPKVRRTMREVFSGVPRHVAVHFWVPACVHLENRSLYRQYPLEDHLLAQALMIVTDEKKIRKLNGTMNRMMW